MKRITILVCYLFLVAFFGANNASEITDNEIMIDPIPTTIHWGRELCVLSEGNSCNDCEKKKMSPIQVYYEKVSDTINGVMQFSIKFDTVGFGGFQKDVYKELNVLDIFDLSIVRLRNAPLVDTAEIVQRLYDDVSTIYFWVCGCYNPRYIYTKFAFPFRVIPLHYDE